MKFQPKLQISQRGRSRNRPPSTLRKMINPQKHHHVKLRLKLKQNRLQERPRYVDFFLQNYPIFSVLRYKFQKKKKNVSKFKVVICRMKKGEIRGWVC